MASWPCRLGPGKRCIRGEIMGKSWLALTGVLVALALLSVPMPTRGIQFGTADTSHTYVGAWVGDGSDGRIGWCSGELVSPHVFVTAGHCVADFLNRGVTPKTTWVTFDTNIFPAGVAPPSCTPCLVPGFTPPAPDWLAVSTFLADPLFNASAGSFHGLAAFDLHDIGAVILTEGVTSVGFATLAPIGLLDSLQATGTLANTDASLLGYGLDQDSQVTAERRITQAPILGAAPHWLFLQATYRATGAGGVNRGDSGGPELVSQEGTEYLVAINNFFTGLAKGITGGYRVDTVSAQTFIMAEIAANS